jgi:cysteine desulfurase
MQQVYFDNQSNTRLDPRVLDTMMPFFTERYGNPQTMYALGDASKEAVDAARAQVAALINARPQEICFTSCGSEANNLAVKGAAEAARKKGNHLVVSGIEHFSVLNAARRLETAGYTVTRVPVDHTGRVSPEAVAAALRPETILVSVQHANPEIGTIQPVAEIARAVRERGILFHTDAVCTAGTIPVDVAAIGADLLTLSAATMYGPKGAAALYVRQGVQLVPQIDGGVQENGRRAGTENVPAIVGFGVAADLARQEMAANAALMARRRDRLIAEVPRLVPYVYLNGHPTDRLPGNSNFSVEFIEGEGMFLLLDQKGIMVASGSACASKSLKMSHVLSALQVDPTVGQGSLVLTLSKYTTDDEITYFLAQFPAVVEKLRSMSPLYSYFQQHGTRRPAGPGTDYEHAHDHA